MMINSEKNWLATYHTFFTENIHTSFKIIYYFVNKTLIIYIYKKKIYYG